MKATLVINYEDGSEDDVKLEAKDFAAVMKTVEESTAPKEVSSFVLIVVKNERH